MLSRLHFEDWEKHLVPNDFNLHSILKFCLTKEDFSYDKSVEHTAISSFVSCLADTATDILSFFTTSGDPLCTFVFGASFSQILGEEVKLFWTKNEMEMINIQNELLKKKAEQTMFHMCSANLLFMALQTHLKLTYLTMIMIPQISGKKERDPQEGSMRSVKSEAEHQYSKTEATKPFLTHSFILELFGSSAIQYEFSNAQWQELVADIPEIEKTKFCEEINPILGPLFVSSDPVEVEVTSLIFVTPLSQKKDIKIQSMQNGKQCVMYILPPQSISTGRRSSGGLKQ
ncbi:hypothetical protein BC936DRAFT_144449 [Jimgerdemannia flammicorona]|uniref:Uncharacterized protein n=1 Tax=Jimgerdemannia flammicorona TaxID=994334 RepID=A0A433DCE7_9FUNG|nr:hypothetical protein BC936DRAFT_144449 [Jimgerdemannia flammicorona]